MPNRLIEEKHLTEANRHWLKPDYAEFIFRYCTFEGLKALEGQFAASIESSFLHCTFSDCEWNDPFFNEALFFSVTFERCTFNGGSFRGCAFVECKFEDCRFERAPHGGYCIFDDVRWHGCQRRGTAGLEEQF